MNSSYGLVFFPRRLEYQPQNIKHLLLQLQSAGFIGEYFEQNQQNGYLIGEHFLKLVTFLGCAPHIEVFPPENIQNWGNFCYIEFQQFNKPQYFKGLKNPKCSCPHCKSRVIKVLPDMQQWSPGVLELVCPKCLQSSLTENLNWRHGAGFGCFFIVVHSVYPNEAVPTDKLMKMLNSVTDETWDYFYFEQ